MILKANISFTQRVGGVNTEGFLLLIRPVSGINMIHYRDGKQRTIYMIQPSTYSMNPMSGIRFLPSARQKCCSNYLLRQKRRSVAQKRTGEKHSRHYRMSANSSNLVPNMPLPVCIWSLR